MEEMEFLAMECYVKKALQDFSGLYWHSFFSMTKNWYKNNLDKCSGFKPYCIAFHCISSKRRSGFDMAPPVATMLSGSAISGLCF